MLVGQAVVYLVFMLGLHRFMKDREPLQCKHAMIAYNAVQVALCYYMTHGVCARTARPMCRRGRTVIRH